MPWYSRFLQHKPTPQPTQRAMDLVTGYVGVGMGSSLTTTGPEEALSISAVFSCVRVIAENIASLPINVYVQTAEGAEVDKVHPAYKIIRYEVSELCRSDNFYFELVCDYLLWGRAYGHIIRNNDGAILRIERIKPSEVITYKYTRSSGHKSMYHKHILSDRVISDTDMIFLSDIDGKSRITRHARKLGEMQAATELTNKMYSSGLMLGGIVEYDKKIDPDTLKNLRTSFKDVYGGIKSAGDVGFIDSGGKFKALDMSMSLSDAEYIAGQNLNKVEVCSIFNVPPHMIQHLEKASFNSIEQQNIGFVQYTLRPTITMMERELNRKLFHVLDDYDHYVKFNIGGLLRGDIATRGNQYKTLFNIGVLSINEIRELEDMNPVEGGELRMIPLNMIPLSQVDQYMELLKTKGTPKNTKEDE